MSTQQSKSDTAQGHRELADGTFMTAADLRTDMTEMQMARASREAGSMDRAGKARSRIERCFNEFKRFRRIATRYDRRATHFLSFIHLTCAILGMR